MAVEKLVLLSLALSIISAVLLSISMAIDQWYVINASKYQSVCPNNYLVRSFTSFKTTVEPQKINVSRETNVIDKPAMEEPFKLSKSRFFEGGNFPRISDEENQHLKPIPLKMGENHVVRRKRWNNIYQRLVEAPLTTKNVGQDHIKPMTVKRSDQQQGDVMVKKHSPVVSERKYLLNSLQTNLLGFGGRDLSNPRVQSKSSGIKVRDPCEGPSGERNLNCTSKSTASMTTDCSKRQLSTVTGLWAVCYKNGDNQILDHIIRQGKLKRCNPISYESVNYNSVPAQLTNDETVTVVQDEWKVLNLRRIVTSFLCMSLPIQMFGSVITCVGWRKRSGFMQHTGGLVMVMSGIFQLLSLGTSALLYSIELNRSPTDIYRLPHLVTHAYGMSTYGAWASTFCIMLAGFLCVVAAMYLQPTSHGQTKQDGKVLQNVEVQLVTLNTHKRRTLQSGGGSLKIDRKPKLTNGMNMSRSLTLTRPYSHGLTLSPVAKVRTHTAALKALEEELRSNMDSDTDSEEIAIGRKKCSMNTTSPYIPKNIVYRRPKSYHTASPVRHSQLVKRSSLTYGNRAKELLELNREMDERKTHSLPRISGLRSCSRNGSRSSADLERLDRSSIYRPTILLLSKTIDRLQNSTSEDKPTFNSLPKPLTKAKENDLKSLTQSSSFSTRQMATKSDIQDEKTSKTDIVSSLTVDEIFEQSKSSKS